MNVVPYDFKECNPVTLDGIGRTVKCYMVTFYFLFDGTFTYTFAHQHDLLDNYGLALDCGVYCTVFTKQILVNEFQHPSIFKEIENYVSGSNSD